MKMILKKLRIPATGQVATESHGAQLDCEFALQVVFSQFTKDWDLEKTIFVLEENGEGHFVVDGEVKSMEFLTAEANWNATGWLQHPTLGATYMMYEFAKGGIKLTKSCVHVLVGWPTMRGNNRALRAAFNRYMGN